MWVTWSAYEKREEWQRDSSVVLCVCACLCVCVCVCVCVWAGVKAKKATEAYKSFVEKYAAAKTEFEQKMAETAQVRGVFVCVCARNHRLSVPADAAVSARPTHVPLSTKNHLTRLSTRMCVCVWVCVCVCVSGRERDRNSMDRIT